MVGRDMFAGVPPAVTVTGENAVVDACDITHHGTCGSNVAPLLSVNIASNVVVRRSTLRYGCAAYSFGAVTGLVFEDNVLAPSGGGSNIQIFGRREEMRRLYYANNTQLLCGHGEARCPPAHLETMTLDGGAGWYEGSVTPSADGTTVVTDAEPPATATARRASWRFAAVIPLVGPGAGQWRRVELQGDTNTTWRLDRPFEPGHGLVSGASFVVVTKIEAQLIFVGNAWGSSHFQLYAACFDCVVPENTFSSSVAISWGRNPHAVFGGWQTNFQVEWRRNVFVGGAGLVLMTSDQPLVADAGSAGRHINASYRAPLNRRVVLRDNAFVGGGGLQLGAASVGGAAQTSGNVMADGNVLLAGACNLTTVPMPAGGDDNRFLPCGRNCSLAVVVLHGNNVAAARSCLSVVKQ